MAETIIVELGTKHFQEANAAVRAALEAADTVCIVEAYAQRYLGCTLPVGKRLEIHGTPGNDLACYMDGGEVEVFGSAQDQTANTMNAGSVVVHDVPEDTTVAGNPAHVVRENRCPMLRLVELPGKPTDVDENIRWSCAL